MKTFFVLLVLLVPSIAYSAPAPFESWSMGGGYSSSMTGGGDSSESVLTVPEPNPELQHYNWNANMTGGDCGYCHAAPDVFLPTSFENEPGFCASCHNAGGMGHDKNLSGKYSHSLFANATASGRRKPSYGNITTGEYNNQPFSRLKDGHDVVCATCHNAMQKPEDIGRTWEFTTTTDQITYSMQNGGWSASGYMVPAVYRDTSLWAGPTYSKSRKAYLVNPSEYAYNEAAGTITFRTAQSGDVYIYVSLDYPYLRASSQDNRLCADCHTQSTHRDNNCLECHRAHNTDNLAGIREMIRTPNYSSVAVRFAAYTGLGSFADGDAVHDGICEVCHTQTKYYRRDGSGFTNHSGGFNYNGTNCAGCHSHDVGFTKTGFAVRIDSPFANTSTSEYSTMVMGTIIGRDNAEVGVTLNGLLAEVNGSAFVLADLPLTAGANAITAVATDANGMTANNTVTVNVVNPVVSQLSIAASPSSGPAPLTVTFTIESTVANAALYELDYEGDGVIDASSATLAGLINSLVHVYTNNGLYYPTFKVTDGAGKVYKKNTVVNVKSVPDLVGMWNSMRSALLAGDVNKAVTYMSLTTRENNRTFYTTLANAGVLSQFASELSDMQVVNATPYTAEGDLRIIENGTEFSYYVLFVKDDDGIWRIHSY